MIKEIITTILVGIASIFGISDNKIANLGAFSDPFLSVQLATGPSNDYCLKTDGTNNLWSSSCGTGGTGGSGAGWASTTADINSVYFTGDNIGKVGVGSSSPYALLSVTNTGTIPSLVVEDSTSPDSTPFIIDASGNVGIGTTNPGKTLDVVGNIQASGSVFSDTVESKNSGNLEFGYVNPSDYQFCLTASCATTAMVIKTTSGNVGIGTTSPSAKLSVNDGRVLSSGSSYTNSGFVIEDRAAGGGDWRMLHFSGGSFSLNYSGDNSSYSKFLVDTSGDVGIGTTTPWGKLSVTNTGTGPSFVVEDSTSPDTTPFIIDASGKVGIGTSTPSNALDVYSGNVVVRSGNEIRAYDTTNAMTLQISQISTDARFANGYGQINLAASTNVNLQTFYNSQYNTDFTLQNGGKIGISTTSPYSQLSVGGKSVSTTLFALDALSGQTAPILDVKLASTTQFAITSTGNTQMIYASSTALSATTLCISTDCRTAWPTGGGGSGGGTWSTTTSSVSGRLVNYPNNTTDIVTIGTTATTSAKMYFDPNTDYSHYTGTIQIGDTTSAQLNAFGSGYYPVQIEKNENDITAQTIWNTSTGSTAGSGLFLNNANTPHGGIGASGKYYAGFVLAGPNWNGVPLGFGALPANGAVIYNTDGPVIVGSATSTGRVDFYTGAGSFAGGIPDMTLTSTANFGLSTSSPFSKMSIHANNGETNRVLFTIASSTQSATTTLLTVTNTGFVGISSSTPYSTLSVTNAGTNPSFIVEDQSSPDSSPFIIDASGNVGVGLTAPLSKVHAKQAGSSVAAITAQTDNTAGRKFISYAYTDGGSEYGNVQIQSNTLRNEFSVQDYDIYHTGGDATLTWKSNSGQPYLLAGNGTASGFVGHLNTADGFVVGSITANNFVIRTNNTNRVTVNATTGNVGIGTTTPGQTLSVRGDILGNNLIGRTLTATSTTATSTIAGGLDLITSTVQQHVYPSFTYATSTSWTGTTTIPLGVSWGLETWSSVKCFTDAGTLNVSFSDGSNSMNMLNASTTVGTFGFTTNNQFTVSEKRFVNIGTPVSSPTTISCTIDKITNI